MSKKDLPEWIKDGRVKRGFMTIRENRLKHLKWLEKRLKYEQPSDWYKVSRNDFRDNYSEPMLNQYYNCTYRYAVKDLYPEYNFLGWLFNHQRKLWDDNEVRTQFAYWIGEPERLNIQKKEDWYKVRQSDLMKHKIYNGFWGKFNNSIADCLIDALPDLELKRWKFGNVPNIFWESRVNRLDFIVSLLKNIKVSKPEEIEELVSNKKIRSSKGFFIVKKGLAFYIRKESGTGYYTFHNNDLKSICKEIFPDYKWEKVNFNIQPIGFKNSQDLQLTRRPGYWEKKENRIKFINELKIILNIKSEEDWYSVSAEVIKKNTGGGFLKTYYNNNHIKLLIENVKEYRLLPWRFINKPPDYWNNDENVINCMKGIYKHLNMKNLDEFYDLGVMYIQEYCYGRTLIDKFSRNMYKICKFAFKNHSWDESKFKIELNLLKSKSERERYLKNTEKDLSISRVNDWYAESTESVRNSKYGSKLLKQYSSSLISMLKDLIPSENWKPWIFERVSRSYWSNEDNQREAMTWLLNEKLNIEISQAHEVTQKDLINFGLSTLLSYHEDSLLKLFTSLFDQIQFDSKLFKKTGSGEKKLNDYLSELFPETTIDWGLFYDNLRFTKTNRPMQLDFYFPELLIAIEYQGEQHYKPAWGDEKTFKDLQQRDEEKRIACKQNGIELIEIRDIFWDKTKQSLIDFLEGTILYDLLLENNY